MINKLLVKCLRSRAVKGGVSSQYMLGRHYQQLQPEYWSRAYAWLSVAAYQGHEMAQNALESLEAKLSPVLLNAGRQLRDEIKAELLRNFRV